MNSYLKALDVLRSVVLDQVRLRKLKELAMLTAS